MLFESGKGSAGKVMGVERRGEAREGRGVGGEGA